MAKRNTRKNPRRRKNLGTPAKVVIGVAAGLGALYALSWATYVLKGKKGITAAPKGSATLPGGEQSDGVENGVTWSIRYDASQASFPYKWKVTGSGTSATSSAAATYADARAAITWAISQGLT